MSSARSIAWLNRFAWLTCIATLFLICSGGMVTSKGVGLAVPDWPLSFGKVFPKMEGGVFYEHGRGGLPKDEREAARLYRLSAEQGNELAKQNLARLGIR